MPGGRGTWAVAMIKPRRGRTCSMSMPRRAQPCVRPAMSRQPTPPQREGRRRRGDGGRLRGSSRVAMLSRRGSRCHQLWQLSLAWDVSFLCVGVCAATATSLLAAECSRCSERWNVPLCCSAGGRPGTDSQRSPAARAVRVSCRTRGGVARRRSRPGPPCSGVPAPAHAAVRAARWCHTQPARRNPV